MGSTILPKALISMSQTIQTPSKLGFPVLSFLPSPLTSIRTAISTPPWSRFCDAITVPTTRRSFAVNAEANPEEGAAEATEESAGEEDAEETASESEASEAEVEERPPRKPRVKLGEIMGILNKRAIEASDKERPIPDLRTGDIVEIKMERPDKKRRAAIFKGIVMCKQNAGIHTTIRIRRIIAGIGVEIVFPVYSPNIKEIKVVSHRKVRRARLYYLRDKLPRFSTFK